MLNLKTHFEQVSLEVVRKIVEEQIQRERVVAEERGTGNKTLEGEPSGAQEPFLAGPAHFPNRRRRRNHESQQRKIQERVPEKERF
jgi:hypothetical protein